VKPEVAPKKPEPVKVAAAPAKTEKPAKAEKPAPAPKAAKADAPVVDPFATKSDKPAGEGTLMISSKPPCEIYVDGKATGLMTPQRAIKLAAGSHKITLVNAAEKLKKTLAVQITADQPTKVIQDLMK
jgi:PEGA domain